MTTASLKITLISFKPQLNLNFLNFKALKPSKCLRKKDQIIQKFEKALNKAPAAYDLKKSHEIIFQTWQEQKSLDGVQKNHLRRLPWVIFFVPSNQKESDKQLCKDLEFLKYYFAEKKFTDRPSRVVSIICQFLVFYPKEFRDLWQSSLQYLLQDYSSPRLDSLKVMVEDVFLLLPYGSDLFAQKILSVDLQEIIDSISGV